MERDWIVSSHVYERNGKHYLCYQDAADFIAARRKLAGGE